MFEMIGVDKSPFFIDLSSPTANHSDTHRTSFFLKLRFAKGGQANIYSLDRGRRNSSFHFPIKTKLNL